MEVALILGAGFSHVAGLPLTRNLFDCEAAPQTQSKTADKNHEQVMRAWSSWKELHPDGNAEQWLQELYVGHSRECSSDTTWECALDFAMARLVKLKRGSKAAYYHGITTSVADSCHRQFWTRIRRDFQLRYVVTTNYDILVEQGLRNEYSSHRRPPICHYGGHPYHQVVRKMKNVAAGDYEDVTLGHEVTLFKLHGSINWAFEPHGFKIHEDVRAAFRTSRERGKIAIVPPLPEKQRPDWLTNVWIYAEESLSKSSAWVVCGYSMPSYDYAMREMLARAASKGVRSIFILDPFSDELVVRWRDIAPVTTSVRALPGLPRALDDEYWRLIKE